MTDTCSKAIDSQRKIFLQNDKYHSLDTICYNSEFEELFQFSCKGMLRDCIGEECIYTLYKPKTKIVVHHRDEDKGSLQEL